MEEDTSLYVDVSEAESQDYGPAYCGKAGTASQILLFRANVGDVQTPDHVLQNGAAHSPLEAPSTTDLCGRCATVPWTRLLEAHHTNPVLVLQDVHEPKEELQRSKCKYIT